jgi:hypothetical protein
VQGIYPAGTGKCEPTARDHQPPVRVDHGDVVFAEGTHRPSQKGDINYKKKLHIEKYHKKDFKLQNKKGS